MCQACGGTCGAHVRRRALALDINVGGRSLRLRDAGGPASLNVSRRLDPACAADLYAWARQKGFIGLVTPDEMHVTVAYSRAPVDWFRFPSWYTADDLSVPAGGPRRVEMFGGGVSMLRFTSDALMARWDEFRQGGCSWDFPGFMPHVTFANGAGTADPDRLKAYTGPLRFGPEEFGPIPS